MKNLTFILSLSIFCFYSSCSSDPCEDVICANGACDQGNCACEDGYTGTLCDQIDLFGTYYYSKIAADPNTNCSQSYLDYNPVLRGESLCDNLGCNTFLYTFNSDLTLQRETIEYEEDANGSLVEVYSRVTDGAYTVEGNVVTITEGLSKGVVLTFDNYVLTDYRSFLLDCFATRTYTKRE